MEPEQWADWKLLAYLRVEVDGPDGGIEDQKTRDAVREVIRRFERMQGTVNATLDWFTQVRDSGRTIERDLSEWRT